MLLLLLSMLGGLALLAYGANMLVKGSAGLALRVGLSPLVVGLTVVSFGTSSPELFVSIAAVLRGNDAIALGNVVGSNISNVALILGLAAFLYPLQVHRQLLRVDVPLMIAASVLFSVLMLDGRLTRVEGAGLVTGLVGYTLLGLWIGRRRTAGAPPPSSEAPAPVQPPGRLGRDVLRIVAGLGMLVLGAHALVEGATGVAERWGLSDAIIGLTIVAVGTSLPELATSVVAALRGEGDIALGNVVGSNLFNLLGILGVSALVHPLQTGGVAGSDLLVMTGLALLAFVLLRSGFRLTRWEGAFLLLLYTGYVAWLLP